MLNESSPQRKKEEVMKTLIRKCIIKTCPQPTFGCVIDGVARFCADCWCYGNGNTLCPETDEETHGICNSCMRELALAKNAKKAPKKG